MNSTINIILIAFFFCFGPYYRNLIRPLRAMLLWWSDFLYFCYIIHVAFNEATHEALVIGHPRRYNSIHETHWHKGIPIHVFYVQLSIKAHWYIIKWLYILYIFCIPNFKIYIIILYVIRKYVMKINNSVFET